MAKIAKSKGWRANAFKVRAIYCPKCAGPSDTPNDPDSELKKAGFMITPVPPAQPVSKVIISKPVELPRLMAVRDATPNQRVKIRALLDRHFDDDAGMYLEDFSDQHIAELVEVPRVIVENIRDAAYGPIKVDAAQQALRAEIAAMKIDLKAMQDAQAEAVRGMSTRVMDLSSKLEALVISRAA